MKSIATGLALTACIWAGTAASAAAPAVKQALYAAPLPDGLCMVAGITPKPRAGRLDIAFGVTFGQLPVITTSPLWTEANMPVNVLDTIVALKENQFTIDSVNKGNSYAVNWIAIGRLPAGGVCKLGA
jgi:hypothetical protein